jgi:DMSO/TMAO reductase YedYZ heme-binding membrane subunit
MDYLRQLIDGMSTQPFKDLLHMLELPPDQLWASFSLLAGVMILCELVRISLGTGLALSRIAHVLVCLLTFALQALLLAFVLGYGDRHHPGRGWINLGIALALYAVWYATGEFTRLVRKDSEGADLGFMAVGALITFPVGIIFALVS